jgi:2-oxoglutarate dehydrogenase E1 component
MDWEREFPGPNAAYILDLYDRYRADPQSVDPQTRALFEHWSPPSANGHAPAVPARTSINLNTTAGPSAISTMEAQKALAAEPAMLSSTEAQKAAAVSSLAQAIRWYGVMAAQLDPLGKQPSGDPALELDTYGLSEADLHRLPASLVGGVAGEQAEVQGGSAWEAIQALREIYSGTIGHDHIQVRVPEERQWLREAAETRRFSTRQESIDPRALLDRLTQVEAFEQFLQRAFVGKTRFSIEGLDMLVPMLDEVVACAANSGIYNILLGMAHRGRLNVLAHILQKPIEQMLLEFRDPLRRRVLQNEPTGWAGDVKYHAGGRRVLDDHNPQTINLAIVMAPNPSHLEAVNPVVEGMARAAGTDVDQPGPVRFNPAVTLPILIHGDAAFPGQGVVAETLNLFRLPGYTTGGTIHIIANNQIGFTTNAGNSRSTLFASDLAKGFRLPIIHVNADDPEGVIEAARTAFAYRQQFGRDFVLDLIGYRRLGHNEGDEPAFTQPLMYQKIQAHPSVRKLWADRLAQAGTVPAEQSEQMLKDRLAGLQQALDNLDPEVEPDEPIPALPPPGAARKVKTAIPAETFKELFQALQQVPEGFTVHPRLARIRQRREGMLKDPNWPSIDWSAAEELALGSILADSTSIRLTGQDVERGTFSHRHAVLHDAANGAKYLPLQALPQARAGFEIVNSPLSEYAALGFEFGYNVQAPERLVIWEAQYGDFINNAQAVVDEFVVSARDKWGQLPSLVMLLPHGYEGQGPDHSSGRLERFLNLAADNNLRVANCTTAANYFHLLRRQAALLELDPLPLVVMTPKSILRHPLVNSPMRDFTEGGWQPVIDRQAPPPQPGQEAHPLTPAAEIRRLILCSGKVYVDLVTSEIAPQHPEVAVARVEQLAPFPLEDVRALIGRYPALEEIAWLQEEPENMGAWDWARPYLEQAAGDIPLRVIARPRAAAPAEGSNNQHTQHQKMLVESAYTGLDHVKDEEDPKAKNKSARSSKKNGIKANGLQADFKD